MPENRLAREKSPYLLQHKNNPVDWYAWSEEAFERARADDRPVFVSIGYSTCHWCHVMERESFEDDEVAQLMNESFVNVKVDREERPDIDQIYMTVCQMATGHGGWPLTVILTPDKRPFYVGTYIPKQSHPSRPGMLDLVPALGRAWHERREEVLRSAESLTEALGRAVEVPVADTLPSEDALDEAFTSLAGRFDEEFGGFGSAPKFPSPHNLLFLLRYADRNDVPDARAMVTRTLKRMRAGGIFDQLGFGFHRYSTDRRWLLPHFEKMLYDQALLLMAYTEAYAATGEALFERTVRETAEYLTCDMRNLEGAFFSAEDADSEGEEGKFYVWTVEEVREVLDDDEASFVIDRFGMAPEGNFVDEATRRRTGANVLHAGSMDDWQPSDFRKWEVIRRKLQTHRHDRVRPGLDDKVLTDWNGLAIAALARAGAVLDDRSYIDHAEAVYRFIEEHLFRDDMLHHRYRDGEAAIDGHLDDYAFVIRGLFELYHATLEIDWLEKALDLQEKQLERFLDEEEGGFFFASSDAEDLLVRQKEFSDGAIPSGNSISMLNLTDLYRLTGDSRFDEEARRLALNAGVLLEKMPAALTGFLLGLDAWIGPSREIVVVEGEGEDALVEEIRQHADGRTVVIRKTAATAERWKKLAPYTEAQTARDGRATVYVCRDFACHQPVTTVDDLRQVLGEA